MHYGNRILSRSLFFPIINVLLFLVWYNSWLANILHVHIWEKEHTMKLPANKTNSANLEISGTHFLHASQLLQKTHFSINMEIKLPKNSHCFRVFLVKRCEFTSLQTWLTPCTILQLDIHYSWVSLLKKNPNVHLFMAWCVTKLGWCCRSIISHWKNKFAYYEFYSFVFERWTRSGSKIQEVQRLYFALHILGEGSNYTSMAFKFLFVCPGRTKTIDCSNISGNPWWVHNNRPTDSLVSQFT